MLPPGVVDGMLRRGEAARTSSSIWRNRARVTPSFVNDSCDMRRIAVSNSVGVMLSARDSASPSTGSPFITRAMVGPGKRSPRFARRAMRMASARYLVRAAASADAFSTRCGTAVVRHGTFFNSQL